MFAALLLAALGKETGLVFVPLMLLLVAGQGDATAPAVAPDSRRRLWLSAGAATVAYLGMRSHALARRRCRRRADLPRVVAGFPALWMRALQAAVLPLDRAPITVGRWIRGLSVVELLAYLLACLAAGGGGRVAVAPGTAAGGGRAWPGGRWRCCRPAWWWCPPGPG